MEPGWYPDPWSRYEHRWHNGHSWTADVAVGGQRHVDPGPLGPLPLAPRTAPAPRNGAAVAALVLGICGLMVGFVPFLFWIGAVLGILAIVFGALGLGRARRDADPSRRGFAIAGLVLGPLGIVAAIAGGIITVLFVRAVDRIVDVGPYTLTQRSCTVGDGRAVLRASIRNDSDEERGYTVYVEFHREGTDNALGLDSVRIDDVAPGETVAFESSSAVGTARVTCVVTDVSGPLPFDLG